MDLVGKQNRRQTLKTSNSNEHLELIGYFTETRLNSRLGRAKK